MENKKSKINFFSFMAFVWSVVAIISGMYAIMNGVGAVAADGMVGDADWRYIFASFFAPGALSCVFAFCKNIDDLIKLKSILKDTKDLVADVKEIEDKAND